MSHGDFVNVEVLQKGATEGVLMLISDPRPQTDAEASTPLLEQEIARDALDAVEANDTVPRSRRSSSTSQPSNTAPVTRRTSSIITPSFTPTIREGEIEEAIEQTEGSRSRKKRSVNAATNDDKEEDSDEMVFHISNVTPEFKSEPEHLRKVSVDNLEHAPHGK